jgi:predicted ATPase/class 3 adenylate cyclase
VLHEPLETALGVRAFAHPVDIGGAGVSLDGGVTDDSRVGQALPAGTVTFFFSDVEGSTRLLRELGTEEYAHALGEHRRLLRASFAAHGGVEVDTQGDAFFVAFPTAPAALRAAAASLDALGGGRIRVRIGIHTGTPELTDEGYVGLDVHRAARIAACGHGGQVLVSATTAALVSGDRLRDLGEHRLSDLPGPERIYQLGDGAFPPLRSISSTNLPPPATPLVGRAGEVAEVAGMLARLDTRLLTLTGPGGTGKTRLALEVAADAASRYLHGVWWIPLAAVREPTRVIAAAAEALGASGSLDAEIGDRSMLLVLDNFEQVIDAAADLSELLAACPRLDLLVTSREPLHLSAERRYPVPPLDRDESVDLFVARGRDSGSEVEVDESVYGICARLDDLPLALELAAARLSVLSPAQILARLDQRLPLLSGGPRDLPARQRTLQATIDWSHELLGAEERDVFARLAVFRGGCALDAAEAVAGAGLDTLASLVDKSLVRHTDERYVLLETIREYALEKLEERDDAGAVGDLHARWFLDLAERAEPELTGPDQSAWLDRVSGEHENLRAALDRFLVAGDSESALRLGAALVVYWFVRGHYAEGRAWLDRSLAGVRGDDSPAIAKALWGAGFLGVLSGGGASASDALERGLAIARRVGDPSSAARCLAVLALLAFFGDDLETSRRLFEESIDAARDAGDVWCLADSLGTLASISALQGDLGSAAEAAGREGLAVAREAGDDQGVRMALFALALAALRRGDVATVAELGGEGLRISRAIGDPWFISYFHWLLASQAIERGDAAAARPDAEGALEVGLQIGGTLLVVCAREALARVELAEGNEAAARRQLDEALVAAAAGGVPASYVSAVELTLGRLAATSGSGEEARAHLETALALAGGVGDTWAADRARVALERLAAAETA